MLGRGQGPWMMHDAGDVEGPLLPRLLPSSVTPSTSVSLQEMACSSFSYAPRPSFLCPPTCLPPTKLRRAHATGILNRRCGRPLIPPHGLMVSSKREGGREERGERCRGREVNRRLHSSRLARCFGRRCRLSRWRTLWCRRKEEKKEELITSDDSTGKETPMLRGAAVDQSRAS